MKNIMKALFSFLFVIMISATYSSQLFGQKRVDISAGIGLPELLNIGVRTRIKQAQIGIGYGIIQDPGNSLKSLSGDFYYHFTGSSKFSDLRPWYGRTGLNYWHFEHDLEAYKELFLNLRFGRDINISKRIGIDIGAGAFLLLYFKRTRYLYPSWELDPGPDFKALPSLGIRLFFRI